MNKTLKYLKEISNNNRNPFSLTTTGVSYYNDFLDPKEQEYLRREKNLKGEVVWMSPEKYIEYCAQIFGTNYESQFRAGSDKSSLESFDELVSEGKKLWMPYLNFTINGGQEGRHRAVWAIKNNIDRIPVLVVTFADEQRAKEEKEEERKFKIENKIEKIFDSFRRYNYKFPNLNSLQDQLPYSIDRIFGEYNKEFHSSFDDKGMHLTIDDVTVDIPKEDIDVTNWEWEDEDEKDLFDYEDLENQY